MEITTRPNKRKPSIHDNLEGEQRRLAKRFDLLNIDSHGKRYIPIAAEQQKARNQPPPPIEDDLMEVEDTKDKVYIHDLDAELAELESDDEKPVFLPDIEKHINKIPKHLLVGQEPRSSAANQLVLYGIPSSLTVPEEKDNVRRAIIEARERAREKQAHGDVPDTVTYMPPTEKRMENVQDEIVDNDPDAMEMD